MGRSAELELFRSALGAAEPPFTVLFVHGPGGVGKSALLDAFADAAEEAGRHLVRLDARELEPVPTAFWARFGSTDRPRLVALIDTFEAMSPLEPWLRTEFLPTLPADACVVIAGREPPSAAWLSDPGWSELLRSVSLRNLDPEDARAYLRVAEVPQHLHDELLTTTYGHPLALTLAAEITHRRGETHLRDSPDLVRSLIARFVDATPGPRHRTALEVCAHARFTTEHLLRAVLGGTDSHELFEWLRGLSFVEEGASGLFPHDLARDALEADLRWRDRESYADLHHRVRAHVIERIHATNGHEQADHVNDFAYLHRNNPAVRGYWDWSTFGNAFADRLRDSDRPALVAMTVRHQGPEQARLLEHWMTRQPDAFFVFRAGDRDPIGYACLLALHRTTESERAVDPGAASMWDYVHRAAAPRPGEEVHAARFFLDRVAYQQPSVSQNLITVLHTQTLFRRARPSWDLIGVYEDGDFWEPLLNHIDYHRAREAEYEVGGRRYAVFAHDWRRRDLESWLTLMGDREIGTEVEPLTAEPAVLVLSQQDFAAAVRAALRDLHRTAALAENPLIRSRLAHGAEDPVRALQASIRDAAATLRADPRAEKQFHALDRTYLRPAATQELAAEVLDLPFSTYRRHLQRGVDQVVTLLWQRELYG